MKHRVVILLASTVVLGACASDDGASSSLDDRDNVRVWANTISAVAVWSHLHTAVAASDGQDVFPDPTCPDVSDDGTTLVITGGCVDDRDQEWAGTATVVRDGANRAITFDGFGRFDPELRATLDGSATVREVTPTMHAFEASLTHEGGATVVIEYSGTVEGGYDGPTTWNGSGTADRFSPLPPAASVSGETIDELLDDTVCAGQAVSGQTRIRGGDHTAVVIYDGETDCDPDESARWTFDGMDRGLVDGVVCSVSAPGAPAAGAALPIGASLVVLGLFASRRRRG